MLKVSASTSTKTGVAPTSATTSAVAQKVNDGQMTASPGPTPLARSASTSASVPLAQVTACLAPQKAASSLSKARTSGPSMNWQWSSTRATAVSTAAPRRRRWAATSMNGIGGGSIRLFMTSVFPAAAVQPATTRGAWRARGIDVAWARVEAAGRDLKAGDAFLAGDRRRGAGAHRAQEGQQLRAQRLGMTDRKMAHGIAAVGLEAEAFGHLPGEQVGHDVFAAGRDGDAARLERRQPVGVDVREHAGGGAELQQRDVLALGHRVRELRLHLDDVGIGEPADQIDVVHREVDHHADIRHARRERTDAGDGDRQNVLVADGVLDRFHRRIEALDMADHQRDAGRARGGDDLPPLLDRRGDRLFHHDVNAAGDAGQRDRVMQMGGRGDGDRIDAEIEQFLDVGDSRAAERVGDEFGLLAVGIGDPDKLARPADRQRPGRGCCP